MDGQLFTALARDAERHVSDFKPQEIANTAWEPATMDQPEKTLLQGFGESCRAADGTAKPQGLASMAWAFATMDQPDEKLFQILVVASSAALVSVPPKVPFAFVDFTSREVLSHWLPHEQVGGRPDLTGTGLDLQDQDLTTLGALGAALRRSSSSRRWFRNMNQWVCAYWRWTTAAIPTGQWDWAMALTYFDTIMRLAYKECIERGGMLGHHIAMLYDELQRRQWAQRCMKGDPDISSSADLSKETAKIDRTIVEMARVRVRATLEAAEVNYPRLEESRTSDPAASGVRAAVDTASAESALAKQAANAEAVRQSSPS